MIPLVTYICLTFWPPPESVLSDEPWHEQRTWLIDHEPSEDEIEHEWLRRQIRILEVTPDERD